MELGEIWEDLVYCVFVCQKFLHDHTRECVDG